MRTFKTLNYCMLPKDKILLLSLFNNVTKDLVVPTIGIREL